MNQVFTNWFYSNVVMVSNVLFMLIKGLICLDINPDGIKVRSFALAVTHANDRITGYVTLDLRWIVAGRKTKLFISRLLNGLPLIPYVFKCLYSRTSRAFTTYTLFAFFSVPMKFKSFMIPLMHNLIYTFK